MSEIRAMMSSVQLGATLVVNFATRFFGRTISEAGTS
jgi:hypothetical protein